MLDDFTLAMRFIKGQKRELEKRRKDFEIIENALNKKHKVKEEVFIHLKIESENGFIGSKDHKDLDKLVTAWAAGYELCGGSVEIEVDPPAEKWEPDHTEDYE